MRAFIDDLQGWFSSSPEWVWPVVLLAVGGVAAPLVIHFVAWRVLGRVAEETDTESDDLIVRRLTKPTRWLAVALGLVAVVPAMPLEGLADTAATRSAVILAILAVAGCLLRTANIVQDLALKRYSMDDEDNLRARRIHTQLAVLKRIATFAIIVLAGGSVLLTFEEVRQFGAAILASAGVAGLVLGLALRPVLENLFAGLQIAITQPIRLDDAVVIRGEWGWIEEITLTYVVVKIWDQRRLIVPFSSIISQPFENWTRQTSEILGAVTLHVDYRAPVGKIREKLEEIVEDEDKWDKRVCVLQSIESGPTTMTLRALVSAGSSPKAWDLRCSVREKLIAFLQEEHPEALPRTRATVDGLGGDDGPGDEDPQEA